MLQTDGRTGRRACEFWPAGGFLQAGRQACKSERTAEINFMKQLSPRGCIWFNWIPKQDVLWVE